MQLQITFSDTKRNSIIELGDIAVWTASMLRVDFYFCSLSLFFFGSDSKAVLLVELRCRNGHQAQSFDGDER
jgi:hypothetical protein